MVDLCFGQRLAQMHIAHCLGVELPQPQSRNCAAISYFPQPRPGIVTRIEGVERVRSVPGVEVFDIDYKVGDTVEIFRNSFDRKCCLVVKGDSLIDARRVKEEALSELILETDSDLTNV